MKFSKHIFCVATCGVALIALSSSANAQFTGKAWTVTSGENGGTWDSAFGQAAGNAAPVAPTSGLQGTFTVAAGQDLDFASSGTLNNFLSSGTTSTGSSYTCTGSYCSSNVSTFSTRGTIVEITGSAQLNTGTTYSVTHDDGITLLLNGSTVLGGSGTTTAGPQGATTSYFHVSTNGIYSVDLFYGECCNPPADLSTNFASLTPMTPTPEPASMVLLATILIGTGIAYKRNRKLA